jgi:F-type H+-transporting ATPase subunit delta
MSYSKITVRYAAALFDLSEEKGLLSEASNDMLLLNEVFLANRDLVLMLHNPVVNADKKRKVVEKIFGSKVNPLTISIINLMIRKRREKYLPSIAEAFTDLYKQSIGLKTAYVTSAVKLQNTDREGILGILGRLTDNRIELIEKTDAALLGGFIVNIDNYQVDQSLATKIKLLKKDFETNLFIKGF